MARKPRAEAAGAFHHVFAHAVHGERLFVDDRDRHRYLRMLGRETVRREWRTLAYCLLTNHVHLLIETPEPNLGHGLQRIHGDYARAHNRRHGRRGALWQSRFGSVVVTDDRQLWTTTRYIARNAVEAGLCATPETWPWASHAATVGGSGPRWLDTARLLGLLAGYGGDPRERYAALVAA